ncbi:MULTISPECIES: GNAT family N-acetyltransferase [unclassified Nocardioides]|jgi:GNAT superfamily N-acetyltransferase|uniref:GNAT family N-acetyltransferase n=1 Tax=unclassified Nocardioides TaxID=2615069 RepID=UPI000702425F|nr:MULTISPECIES: GNAT family N-acetyltransferase [unclassified Nocardioides]KRC53444.1 GCN5 family acetyltransferase [Nocardioides sp. Root79]KRC68080.1 GCN5 family acetyltransferase [Nocardioides sp. Root240]
MARTTVPLTLDLLDALDAPCRSCLFWEREPVRRDGLSPAERAREKEAWVSEVLREWGSCGRVAVVDGEPVGYLTYAPAAFVPGAAAFPTAPVSADAVLLTTAWIRPGYAGGGLGRLLVQGMARDLTGRDGIRAVEAFARTGRAPAPPGGTSECVVPAEFLARVGFKTHRPHPRTPRMRMEMRSLVTWRGEMEAAWEKIVGVVRRPHGATAPVPREARNPRP